MKKLVNVRFVLMKQILGSRRDAKSFGPKKIIYLHCAAFFPCMRAIDRFSRECCQQPTGALANQSAACHLRQSGRLSVRHALGGQVRILRLIKLRPAYPGNSILLVESRNASFWSTTRRLTVFWRDSGCFIS